MQPQPSHPNHRLPPAPSAFYALLIPVWVSLWTSLWPLDQREYAILHCPNTSQLTLFTPVLAHHTKLSAWDGFFMVSMLPPSATWTPGDKRAVSPSAVHGEQGNSFWGVAVLELFIRGSISKYSAQALNNSCLASVFIGAGSRGVIRHYGELWFN